MTHRTHTRLGLTFCSSLAIVFLVSFCVERSDAGSSLSQGGWTEVPIPGIDGFKISFADSLHGWIISQNGTIIYTSDAGTTWQLRQCPVQIVDATLVSDDTGWVRPVVPFGGDTLLYKSTDTGLSWAVVRLPRRMLSFAQTVSFISESVVYAAVIDTAFLFSFRATTDGGESWTRRSSLVELEGANMGFFDADVGYVGNALVGEGTPVILLRTTDAGFTWTTIENQSNDPGAFESFRFFNGRLGCFNHYLRPEIGPTGTTLRITWNKGESWIGIWNYLWDYPQTHRLGMGRDSMHLWLLRYSGTVRRSTNGGATWQEDTPAVPIADILYDLYGHQFALGAGRLFRYDSTATAVDESRDTPKEFALFQNYPNPFNPTTTITYSLHSQERDGSTTPDGSTDLTGRRRLVEVRSLVTLKVYDVLGREVATLVNEQKKPGSHSVAWDARGIASGVYIYRLMAGGLSAVRRMILIR